MPQTYTINRDQLSAAIIKLNSMSRCDGIVMTHVGQIEVGNLSDEQTLCMLVPAALLARQLTEDGLSCYEYKELKKWADEYPLGEIEAILDTFSH